MRRSLLTIVSVLLLASGCMQAEIGDGYSGGADAGDPTPLSSPDAGPSGADATPPAPDAGPVAAILSHSQSPIIAPANSVACRNDLGHTDNSYYRVFGLPSFGILTDFSVTSVSVGIESATSGIGTQPVTVRLHTLTGPLLVDNLTPIATTTLTLPDQAASSINVPLSATVPAGSTLVVEVSVPDGQELGNLFKIGSNSAGQTSPSYLRAVAEGCDLLEPTDLATIDFPDVHFVISAAGTHY